MIRSTTRWRGKRGSSCPPTRSASPCMSADRRLSAAPTSVMHVRLWCSHARRGYSPRFMAGEPQLCPQRHRRRRQDHRAARAEGVDPQSSPPATSVSTTRTWRIGRRLPTIAPQATGHVGEMVAMIARLVETGNAYEADGHVLFHVPGDPDYGALGRRDREAMIAGARVEVASYKRTRPISCSGSPRPRA